MSFMFVLWFIGMLMKGIGSKGIIYNCFVIAVIMCS